MVIINSRNNKTYPIAQLKNNKREVEVTRKQLKTLAMKATSERSTKQESNP